MGQLSPGDAYYNTFYSGPAGQQKGAYTSAGGARAKFGTQMRDWYKNEGNSALDFFGTNPNGVTAPKPAPGILNPDAKPVITQNGPGANSFHGASTGVSDPNNPARNAGRDARGAAAAYDAATTPDTLLHNMLNNEPKQARDFYDTMQGPDARPTQQQEYDDYMKGRVGEKTNQETLYNERRTGGDPAAAFEDSRAVRDLNNQTAARGGFNSGAAIRGIGDYYANANAQRSRDLSTLAGGADSSRNSLDRAYGDASAGASGEQRGYFNDLGGAAKSASGEQSDYYKNLFKSGIDLAAAKSGVFTHYSDRAGDAYTDGQLADIDARLAAAGVDAAARKQMMDDLKKGGAGAAKLATG